MGPTGMDSPEWDQLTRHQGGSWFNHGTRVKSASIREMRSTEACRLALSLPACSKARILNSQSICIDARAEQDRNRGT